MISRDPECECEISAEMIWPTAIQLCHHSTVAEAERVQEKLMDLMTNFSQNIDANSHVRQDHHPTGHGVPGAGRGKAQTNAERG